MNKFFSNNFNISKINICVYVEGNTGQNIHKNRPSHGLVFELSGRKKYIFDNGKSMEVRPNDVFYLPKFSDYEVVSLEKGDCIAVNFEIADENVTYPFFNMRQETGKYKRDFEKLLSEWNSKKDGHMNLCYMYLYGIICKLQSDFFARYVPSKARVIAYSGCEYIAQNIDDTALTVEMVSEMLQITPEYFRKLFRDIYGCSPRKYIIDMRMDKAKKLLLSREFLVSEISRMCGYESESYFSKEFKRICGCSPSEYKK